MDVSETLNPGHAALRKGRVSLAGQIYLVTTVTQQRHPWFADFSCAAVAARCIDSQSLWSGGDMMAWVLMPDHAHWLLRLGPQASLSSLVNRVKSASARAVNCLLQRSGALWAAGFHDHALRRDEDLKQAARYLVANPVRAGLVSRIGDYPFWNAVWL